MVFVVMRRRSHAPITRSTPPVNGYVRIGWQCDGKIADVARSSNHGAATIVVDSAGKSITLEGVDEEFWKKARRGDHITKSSGSRYAVIDGQKMLIVRRGMGWWNDPE